LDIRFTPPDQLLCPCRVLINPASAIPAKDDSSAVQQLSNLFYCHALNLKNFSARISAKSEILLVKKPIDPIT
jgi:hypothetical protein